VIESRGFEIVRRSLIGDQNVRRLAALPESLASPELLDISADGRRILIRSSRDSMVSMTLNEDQRPEPVVEEQVDQAALSPDGAWTVYHPNNEPGIYVQPLASRGLRRQIATSGRSPVWRRDGKEIVYVTESQIWSVRVDGAGTQLRFAAPEALFSVSGPLGLTSGSRPLAVSRDGSKIFYLQSTEEPDSGVINVRTDAIR